MERTFPTTSGAPELRRALAGYLRRARGVVCEPEQIVITQGTQQAIDLVARRDALVVRKFGFEPPAL